MTTGVAPVTGEPACAETIRAWEAFWSLEDLGRSGIAHESVHY